MTKRMMGPRAGPPAACSPTPRRKQLIQSLNIRRNSNSHCQIPNETDRPKKNIGYGSITARCMLRADGPSRAGAFRGGWVLLTHRTWPLIQTLPTPVRTALPRQPIDSGTLFPFSALEQIGQLGAFIPFCSRSVHLATRLAGLVRDPASRC